MSASDGAGGSAIPDPRPWPRHGVRKGTEYRIFTTTFEDLDYESYERSQGAGR